MALKLVMASLVAIVLQSSGKTCFSSIEYLLSIIISIYCKNIHNTSAYLFTRHLKIIIEFYILEYFITILMHTHTQIHLIAIQNHLLDYQAGSRSTHSRTTLWPTAGSCTSWPRPRRRTPRTSLPLPPTLRTWASWPPSCSSTGTRAWNDPSRSNKLNNHGECPY